MKRYFKYENSHRTIDGVKQKRCTKCKKWKNEGEFGKKSNNRDGLSTWCTKCRRQHARKKYKKDSKPVRRYYSYEESHRVVNDVKEKRCRRCGKWKTESEFYRRRRNKDGLAEYCKICTNKATNRSRKRRLANKICSMI